MLARRLNRDHLLKQFGVKSNADRHGYFYLDSPAETLSAEEHCPAYGSDGDYWSMPNIESIFDMVYEMMSEVDPERHPKIY